MINGGVRIGVSDIDPDGLSARISVTRTAARRLGVRTFGRLVIGDGRVLLKEDAVRRLLDMIEPEFRRQ